MPAISRFFGIIISMYYMENWERARAGLPLKQIDPLD
jgi:hypothetical protein